MTHKFKIGDEVVVTGSYCKYKIIDVHDCDPLYILKPIGYCYTGPGTTYAPVWARENELELATNPKEAEMEKPKFKVGDRVNVFRGSWKMYEAKIVGWGFGNYYLITNGDIGVINRCVKEDKLELADDKPAEPFEPVESVNSKVKRQMKFEIYDEKKEQNSIILKLSDGEAGSVCVDIVYKNGVMKGPIVRFNTDGTITRYHSVDKSYGFKLDEEGRISIRER
jgi:hypothetical protein